MHFNLSILKTKYMKRFTLIQWYFETYLLLFGTFTVHETAQFYFICL